MPLYHDSAVVLRTHKLGEADRIITLLTRGSGLKRAVARGVRKTSSRLGARLEPFSIVDFQCYTGRSLDSVREVQTVSLYGAQLAGDYEAYQAASAVCETALQITEADWQPEHYLLVAGVLGALAKQVAAPKMLLASYFLRALATAGWGVQLENCAGCGAGSQLSLFSVQMGGVLCSSCGLGEQENAGQVLGEQVTSAQQQSVPLAAGQLELLQALAAGNWPVVNAAPFALAEQTAALVTSYSQWHLDRSLRSLSAK